MIYINFYVARCLENTGKVRGRYEKDFLRMNKLAKKNEKRPPCGQSFNKRTISLHQVVMASESYLFFFGIPLS